MISLIIIMSLILSLSIIASIGNDITAIMTIVSILIIMKRSIAALRISSGPSGAIYFASLQPTTHTSPAAAAATATAAAATLSEETKMGEGYSMHGIN